MYSSRKYLRYIQLTAGCEIILRYNSVNYCTLKLPSFYNIYMARKSYATVPTLRQRNKIKLLKNHDKIHMSHAITFKVCKYSKFQIHTSSHP